MIRRMKPYTHQRFITIKDEHGEQIKQWEDIGLIEMAISLNSGTQSTTNNILTSSSTHVAITDSKAIAAGDRLAQGAAAFFTVDYVVLDGRKTLLYLKKDSTNGN